MGLAEYARYHWMSAKAAKKIRKNVLGSPILKSMGVKLVKDWDHREIIDKTKGIRGHWLSRGGHIEASTVHENAFELPQDVIGFHVAELEEKMTNGTKHWNKLVEQGSIAFVNSLVERIDALVAAAGLAPGDYEDVTFVIWKDSFRFKWFTEQDNWYYHFLANLTTGAVVLNPPIPSNIQSVRNAEYLAEVPCLT